MHYYVDDLAFLLFFERELHELDECVRVILIEFQNSFKIEIIDIDRYFIEKWS